MYNFFRQGWIVERIATMAERVFGCPPLVLILPYEETPQYIVACGLYDDHRRMQLADHRRFARHKEFLARYRAGRNLDVDGFRLRPETNGYRINVAIWSGSRPTTLIPRWRETCCPPAMIGPFFICAAS